MMHTEIDIRPMEERDLDAADRVFRLAFGTFFQLPVPMNFRGDGGLVHPRWRMYRDGGVVAEREGAIVGMCFASRWGSLGVLGPVAVHPTHWKHGIARMLVPATLDIIDGWGCRMAGLFTFPQSASHLRLYQSFGFWPRFLTPVLSKAVTGPQRSAEASLMSKTADRAALVASCRALTDSIYAGLDMTREIEGVLADGLGDVVLLSAGSAVDGFAICHAGAGSEGGSAACYLKFAAVRSGIEAADRLSRLVLACEDYAHGRGFGHVTAGVTTGRHGAYRLLVERGFRMQLAGVAMHRPAEPCYDRPDAYVLDDWR